MSSIQKLNVFVSKLKNVKLHFWIFLLEILFFPSVLKPNMKFSDTICVNMEIIMLTENATIEILAGSFHYFFLI